MEKGMFACFLLLAAGQDLKRKEVNIWTYIVFGIAALGLALMQGLSQENTYNWVEHFCSISLGLGLLGMCMLTQGKVGAGDGWFFVVSGVLLGFWENFLLLSYGTVLCGVFCLCWMMIKKLRGSNLQKEQTVPFLPFVAIPGIYYIFAASMK